MNLTRDEIVLSVATQAVKLKIHLDAMSDFDSFAIVEAIKTIGFRSKREADICVREFLRRKFKREAACTL